MKFKKLNIKDWQQFENIEIDFHERLTILTGANASGKTTILQNILAKHFGWNTLSCATPKKNKETGFVRFFSSVKRFFGSKNQDKHEDHIGYIEYEDGNNSNITIPNQNSAQYEVSFQNQQYLEGLFIPSHRQVFRYEPLQNIPLGKKDKRTAFHEVSNANKDRYLGHNNQSSSFFMKNTLISWAYQGYRLVDDNNQEMTARDEEQVKFYEGFKDVLRKVLPKTLGFENFEIRSNEVVFICNAGEDEFTFEQASGGVSALIDMAWQIYMFSTEGEKFTVIIDEIENHLHPEMQRQILRDLLNAFPNACFIVSTHSPLLIGSVKESNVFALKYNDNKKIVSQKLDLDNEPKTATEILDEVLGVSFTMPIWAEESLNDIVNKYAEKEITKQEFTNMRKELKGIGLEKLMPEGLEKLIEKANEKNK